MSDRVNMVRNGVKAGGRERFSCSAEMWSLLLEVGKTFGWKPLGASYIPDRDARTAPSAMRHDYRPGDPLDQKLIDAEDAAAWARALSEARSSPHFAAMLSASRGATALQNTDENTTSIEPSIVTAMDEFIDYAFGGAFAFARAE